MQIERHDSTELFSQIVIHDSTIYMAGQVAKGKTVKEQMTTVLHQIESRLLSVGSDRSKLLSAMIWLADIDTFDEMNEVWLDWIDPVNKPVRATVEARLAEPSFLVEVMVLAAR